MRRIATALPDVALVEPQVFGDSRGYFMETYNAREFERLGLGPALSRIINRVRSKACCGACIINWDAPKPSWCGWSGRGLRRAVDLRRGSPTFGVGPARS